MIVTHLVFAFFVAASVWADSINPRAFFAEVDGDFFPLASYRRYDVPGIFMFRVGVSSEYPVKVTFADGKYFTSKGLIGDTEDTFAHGKISEPAHFIFGNGMRVINHSFYSCKDSNIGATVIKFNSSNPTCSELKMHLLPFDKITGRYVEGPYMPEEGDMWIEPNSVSSMSSPDYWASTVGSPSSTILKMQSMMSAVDTEVPESSASHHSVSDSLTSTIYVNAEPLVPPMSDLNESLVPNTSDVLQSSNSIMSDIPETTISTMFDIPESSVTILFDAPELSVSTMITIPESAVSTRASAPESSVSSFSDISKSSVSNMDEYFESTVSVVDRSFESSVLTRIGFSQSAISTMTKLSEALASTKADASKSSSNSHASSSSTPMSAMAKDSAIDESSKWNLTTLTRETTSTATICTGCKVASIITVRKTYTDFTIYCPEKTTMTVSVCEGPCHPSTVTVTSATTLTFTGKCIVPETITVYETSSKGAAKTIDRKHYASENYGKSPSYPKNGVKKTVKAGDSARRGAASTIAIEGFAHKRPSKSSSAPNSPKETAKVEYPAPKPTKQSNKLTKESNAPKSKFANSDVTTTSTLTATVTISNASLFANGASKNAIGAFIFGFAVLLM